MKRSIICMILVILFSTEIVLATDTTPIIIVKEPIVHPSGPTPLVHVLNYIPVSATIDDSELAIYFELSIGDATITVTDSINQVVYQETVDTNSLTDLQIPVDLWTIGNYKLAITYGSTTLTGEFLLE